MARRRDPASQRRRHQIAPVEDLGHEPGLSSAAERNSLMSPEKTTHSEHGAEEYSRLSPSDYKSAEYTLESLFHRGDYLQRFVPVRLLLHTLRLR
jgi:hypothetical protein